ncbi:short-chain dehydrogenase [Croceicoccus estronivorus]|uniref:SDR family NAD(P)-dependent oxidoreductase n=1 Tax=Croceicoccus estronivorus TaxID=1172626 RepID=UPI00082DA6D1|nr:SDR family NAD(P)-dependent oxidoreductase [Croceicoccus estronivorus]OCC23428.1 short-chain dehydrogenase [Croceicoccus estronivorus]
MRYQGKVVIVTGAASGIGAATAVRLADEGAQVICADINEAGAQATSERLAAGESAHFALGFNGGDAASCRGMVAQAVERAGRIDMLCNIAGIMAWGPVGRFSEEDFDRVLRINLSSLYYLSKAALPHLLETKGNIVNMASAAGLVGIAYNAAYCASKAGVIAMTRSMAIEFAAAGVRINAICPTGVKTPMTGTLDWPDDMDPALLMRNSSKMGEMIDAEDVAASVAFLGSEDARQITGVALPVDGAQTAG